MGVAAYARSRAFEALFSAVAACALCFTACSAFYATQPLQQLPAVLVPLACVVLLVAALFACAYDARAALWGGIAIVAAAVAALVVAAVANPGATPADDVEGNGVPAVLIVLACALAVFFAGRTRAGCVVLFVAGSALCAFVEYLYWYGHVGALIVFLAASGALAIVRGYAVNLARSDSAQLAFGSVAAAAAALVAGALLLGGGFYLLVVAPLDPPSQQVKLFVEYRSVQEIQIIGTGSTTSAAGGQAGNLANGDERESDREAQEQTVGAVRNGVQDLLGMNRDQSGDVGSATSWLEQNLLALVVLAALAAAVAAVAFGKRALRRRALSRMCSQGNEAAVRSLYLFFLSRFGKLRIPHPQNLSPGEYARGFDSTFAAFEQRQLAPDAPTFTALSDAYARVVYGGMPAGDDDVEAFRRYYDGFFRNACRYLGRLRYAVRYLFL